MGILGQHLVLFFYSSSILTIKITQSNNNISKIFDHWTRRVSEKEAPLAVAIEPPVFIDRGTIEMKVPPWGDRAGLPLLRDYYNGKN
jgi:hypothetical protein